MNDSPAALLVDVNGNIVGSQADAAGLTRVATDARITGRSGLAADVLADGTVRRLAVDVRNARPAGAQLVSRYLANGATTSMMVSATAASPAKYSYAPSSGTTATVQGVSILATASTINFAGTARWLNAGALPNGLQIGVTVSGVTTVIATLKSNEDWLAFSTGTNYASAVAGGLYAAGTSEVLVCSIGMSQQLASTDSVFVAVQDNVTAVNTANNLLFLQSSVSAFVNV